MGYHAAIAANNIRSLIWLADAALRLTFKPP